MKTIDQFLAELDRLDIQLSVNGDRLRLNAPQSVLSDTLRAELTDRKAEIILHLQSAGRNGSSQPAIKRISRELPLPLSSAQRRLWFLDQLEGPNATYNVPIALRLQGELSIDALAASFRGISRRHEVLRTRFVTRDGEPFQIIDPADGPTIPVEDLGVVVEHEREHTLRRLVIEEARRPFDLAKGPVFRVLLYRLSDHDHVLLANMHHIASDGWSLGVLVKELMEFYEAFSTGREATLPELSLQYVDYAAWHRDWLTGEVLDQQLEYWRNQLAGLPPVLDIPTDRPRPSAMSYRGDVVEFQIDEELTSRLHQLSRGAGGTMFMTLLAAYATLLSRYSNQHDVAVGTTIANRNHRATEPLIGFFVNTLVLRANMAGNPSFRQLLDRVRSVCLDAFDHQDLPFEQLVEAIQPGRNLSHTPLFQAMLMLQNMPVGELTLPRLSIRPEKLETKTAHFDLNLSLTESSNRLEGAFEFRTDLFDRSTIVRMTSDFKVILQAVATNADAGVNQIPLLTDEQRQRQLFEWNETQCEYSRDKLLHQLFEEQADRDPVAVAVVCEGIRMTYGELNARANRLARHLRTLNVGPESKVCVYLERSTEMIVALLGILKAGGAYVPVHHTWPKKRIEQIVFSQGITIMVTRSTQLADADEIQRGVETLDEVICLDCSESHEPSSANENLAESAATSENTAYIIFTSGSTGEPKGVVLRHKPVINLIEWVNRRFDVGPADRVLFVTSICFDLSVYDIFGLLAAGGSIHVATEAELQEPERLVNLLQNEPITFWDSAPAALEHLSPFFPASAGNDSRLRLVFLSGDWIPVSLPDRVRASFQNACVISLGGATEAAIWSNYYEIGVVDPSWPSIPYGRPIANARYYILDSHLNPCPIGVAGELHIGGECLASGYANDPAQTAEKFIPDPFCGKPEAVMYKTGDLTRFHADGNIEILGRLDHQVKIRGYRIETGEIESALTSHPIVENALVTVREDRSAKCLVAYVGASASHGDEANVRAELTHFLAERLPAYMLPSAFVVLDKLPLTPNGKVDREALPAPDWITIQTDFEPPTTDTEKILHSIWCEILGQQDIGIYDNFFELGGDSIISIQAIARARQAGLRITARQMFQHQTIAEQAAVVENTGLPVAELDQTTVVGDARLSPIQHWFFQHDSDFPHHFNQSLLLETPAEFRPELLEAVFHQLVEHHDALRSRFQSEDGQWRQSIVATEENKFVTIVDLSGHSPDRRRAILEANAAELQASLNINGGPLLRVAYYHSGPRIAGRLLIIVHHLVIDGVSWRIIIEDFWTGYQQAVAGERIEFPPKTTSIKQWTEQLHRYAQEDAILSELEFWQAYAIPKVASLPLDYPRASDENTAASSQQVSTTLSAKQTESLLREVPRAYNTRINDALLAALSQTLAGFTRERTIVVNMEGHGREQIFDELDVTRTVGWFTTMYPVLLQCDAEDPGELLKSVKEQLRRLPSSGLGYGLLRYLCNDDDVREQLQRLPTAEISFNYLGQLDSTSDANVAYRPATESTGPSHDPRMRRPHLIDVGASVSSGVLQVSWLFSSRLFDVATIERLAEQYKTNLVAIIQHCREEEAGGYTPSDFPEAELTQDVLDQVLLDIELEGSP